MNIREMIGEDRLAQGMWWGVGKYLVWGCTKVSESCHNCWAEDQNRRFFKKDWSKVHFDPTGLKAFRKKEPTVFSIWTDLFHEAVTDEALRETLLEMFYNPQHVYMVLTKRPSLYRFLDVYNEQKKVKNLWLGTTVESSEYLHRIDDLLKLRPYASKLFVSVEPMLGEINLETSYGQGVGDLRIENLDLVIAGSESGTNRRKTDIEWIRGLRNQCQAAGVPFFLKQMEYDGKLVKAPWLDGRQWLQLPDMGE